MSGYQALREEKSLTEKSASPYSADGAWEDTPFTAHEAKLDWEVPENLVETLVGENAANLSQYSYSDHVNPNPSIDDPVIPYVL